MSSPARPEGSLCAHNACGVRFSPKPFLTSLPTNGHETGLLTPVAPIRPWTCCCFLEERSALLCLMLSASCSVHLGSAVQRPGGRVPTAATWPCRSQGPGGLQLGAVPAHRPCGIAPQLVDSFPTHEYRKSPGDDVRAAALPAGPSLQVALRWAAAPPPPRQGPPPRLPLCRHHSAATPMCNAGELSEWCDYE